jgi:hypothetical protein
MLTVALLSRDMSNDLDAGRFGDIAAALRVRGFKPVACPYDEAPAVADRAEALAAASAAVLAWVNPMQDGRDRRALDALLRRAEAAGTLIGSRPDVIDRLGVKRVLAATASIGWSGEAVYYADAAALAEGLAGRLASGARVLKPNRGNGGAGVWKVEAAGQGRVRVAEAASRRAAQEMALSDFLHARAAELARVEGFVDQAFQPRLGEGMIRVYLAGDRVIGFGWQLVRALLDTEPAPPRTYSGPDDPRFQHLRRRFERDWTPALLACLDLSRADLPVLWDADFLFGPPDADGRDTHVLCEINASSVHPYPATAPAAVADLVAARLAPRGVPAT